MSDAGREEIAPQIRLLTFADIPAAQRLRELAGWNQTEQDWRNLLTFEPNGCFAAEIDGKLVGTATTTRYVPASGPGSFGWIGMVLVDPDFRRYGIGSALLNNCIAYLQSCDVETIKLDATPLGKKVYDKLGFVDEYKIERWEGLAKSFSPPQDISISRISSEELAQIFEMDRKIFGADRRNLLSAWQTQWPELAFGARKNGRILGYSLARRGTKFQQIGPIVGDSLQICEAIFRHALTKLAGEKVIVDILSDNPVAIEIVKNAGLKMQRPLIRMSLGPNSSPGERDKVFAICCPELG